MQYRITFEITNCNNCKFMQFVSESCHRGHYDCLYNDSIICYDGDEKKLEWLGEEDKPPFCPARIFEEAK